MHKPTGIIELSNNVIDLWTITPNKLTQDTINWLSSLLSASESEHIHQYKNKAAKHTALITRAICRLVLSQYTQKRPLDLNFIRNQHGKPELVNNSQKIRFNLSHNKEKIIMAVCVKDDIGCDIEDPTRKVSIETITRRYFAKQEYDAICNLPTNMQQQRFFEVWTLKEAFVKATGIGISLGLDTFHFNFSNSTANFNQLVKERNNEITIKFNDNYPLVHHVQWKFYQAHFDQQLLAICRASDQEQTINDLNTTTLIELSRRQQG